jgi:hypothetical protein
LFRVLTLKIATLLEQAQAKVEDGDCQGERGTEVHAATT